MSDAPAHPALFAGLIRDEAGEPVETVMVGNTPCYVVLDDDFRRHIEAETVDRQVLAMLRDQFMEHREIATEAMMQMLQKDDLFTKALIDASVKNMDQVIERGLPDEARAWLGMLGFQVIINTHGELVRLDMPEQEVYGE
ncbi:MAG: hypothetical protein JXM73_25450 [Anaerolineae bacterium]|nr:hypothetical protein [Anaerolineae bacterium]